MIKNSDSCWTLSGASPSLTLNKQGFVRLDAAEFACQVGVEVGSLDCWIPTWDRLPLDPYLLDGGRYRRRRHSCWVHDVSKDLLLPVEHRAHWQSVNYNALHGGLARWFETMEEGLCSHPLWSTILVSLGNFFSQQLFSTKWFIEAHQFRIDTTDGLGHPTPEGAHRDGVDFVVVVLVRRHNVRGGETRVFDAISPHGIRFIMNEPWSALLIDDARVIHETTPIQSDGPKARRDSLVLTFRRDGFQSPESSMERP